MLLGESCQNPAPTPPVKDGAAPDGTRRPLREEQEACRRVATLTLSAVVVLIVGVWPIVEYRNVYTFDKRLREVDPGRVYRSGEMTAAGFADAVARYKIRTILNLQDDYPDPDVTRSFWNWNTVKETELCRQLGVRYVLIKPDLIFRRRVPVERPAAVDAFLDLMDDPDAYPVLIHCKAGLHRTGCLTAVYRMEYQGWSPDRAYDELRGARLRRLGMHFRQRLCERIRAGIPPRPARPKAVAHRRGAVLGAPEGRKGADGIEDAGATE